MFAPDVGRGFAGYAAPRRGFRWRRAFKVLHGHRPSRILRRGVLCAFYGVVPPGRIMQRDLLWHLPIANAGIPSHNAEETLKGSAPRRVGRPKYFLSHSATIIEIPRYASRLERGCAPTGPSVLLISTGDWGTCVCRKSCS